MNPTAIYSKSGKGVQEASGKTSLLKRADRAVLSAIDGRATIGEVAQKVGKPFDAAFQALIAQLDREGFVREISAGAGAPAAAFAKGPAAKPAPPAGGGEDLDFTGILTTSALRSASQPKPADDAARRAKEQEQALYRARQEAEARAQQERERARAAAESQARAEAEAKFRAEAEKRLREEAEAKLKAEAEAKAKAAREAAMRLAAEAKAKAEAEAKAKIEAERRAREEAERRAREEAERVRREAEAAAQAKIEAERRAREEAERKAREEAERARREAEELRQRLEEERKAREAEEQRRREEEERRRREEEARRKAEEEARRKAAEEEARRKADEEARRKAAEEEARRKAEEEARRKAEEEERLQREEEARQAREAQEAEARRAREEAERRQREDEARREREEEERRAREKAEQARRQEEEAQAAQARARQAEEKPAEEKEAEAPRAAAKAGGGLDALLDDIESFSQREEEEERRKEAEEAERKAKQEAERKAREAEEQRRREDEERRRREEQEAQARRSREEAERKAREEEEERERSRQAAEAAAAAAAAPQGTDDDIGVSEEDLDLDDVRQDQAAISKESRKAQREREREARKREKEARERERAWKRAAEASASAYKPARVRRPRKWGRSAAVTLFVLLVAGVGVLHVMPVPVDEYERAASQALGRAVRIDSGRLSLLTGVSLNLRDVRIGEEARIAAVRAYPQIGSLFGERKAFSRIELEGVTLPQEALGEPLFGARARGPGFSVERVVVKDLKVTGPVPLPLLGADIRLRGDGTVREATLSGPEDLYAKLLPAQDRVDFDMTASSFTLPIAPEVSLGSFAMKGSATRHGLRIESWGGTLLGGALSGTANVRWGGSWQVDGVMTARGINAAVFAPALLSRGKADGTGKFTMSDADPGKLVGSSRIEGSFSVEKGVLGSFDLSRAIQTDGRQASGRTEFSELSGQGTYDRGTVALRNVSIGAGALTAGASADIAQSGALSGRIVADIKTASQALRATLLLGGTVKDPQVRN